MQRNTDRVLTTHVGSLPRPIKLLEGMKSRLEGKDLNEKMFQSLLSDAVNEIVKKQTNIGIDIITDGEMSKSGFFTYIEERIDGFVARKEEKFNLFEAEINAFPEYYEEYMKRAMLGGQIVKMFPMYCIGPVSYKGQDAIKRDINNLRTALADSKVEGAFIPATAPAGVGKNEYYSTEEEFAEAVAEALRIEYECIVESGFLLQIDDPFLCDILVDPRLDDRGKDRKANTYIEAINHSTRNIPEENIRYHTCYGINEGPRIHEASGAEVAMYMLKIKAGSYSFEAANPRHEHDYHIWEELKLPEGRVLIPGVITHASNIVEHPKLICERVVRYAKLVGRDNVLAGADCGFSSQACYHTEVHPTVIWAKFEAMVEGARMATKELW